MIMSILDDIPQRKIRRIFRAKRKLNVPGLVSHVTQRAAGKEPLFLEDPDYLYMLVLLKNFSRRHAIDIYAFCLMPNHVHLLMRPEKDNLYDAMRDLFSRYAMWFNKKYERKGHLFGGPYRQAVCLDDGYLLAASVYIHLNPVKAGLVTTAEAYRWSSVKLYFDDHAPKAFVNPFFILNVLSPGGEGAKAIYRDLLNRSVEVETAQVFEQEDVIDRLRVRLVSLFPALFSRLAKRNRSASAAGLELLDMEALEEKMKSLKEHLHPQAPETRLAKKFLVEQLIARGYKRTEIAEHLGISRKSVYNILNKGHENAKHILPKTAQSRFG
jgi:putative transposase